MKIVIKGTNTDLTPSLKEYVYEKVGSLEKFFKRVVEVNVELEVDRKHKSGEIYRAEVMMFVPRDVLRAEEKATDMYAAIDLVIPKLAKQLEKYKGKIKGKHIKKARFMAIRDWFSPGRDLKELAEEADQPRIVKRKRFSLTKPMTEAEAIRQMNLIGHDFFLFNNAQTNRMSVVYKREDKNYGIIEPE
ncbi:ribosome hibernation-promoting factor, HPF/YfiA family [Patescibacteria group bacterium]